jgi:hypothetical protein
VTSTSPLVGRWGIMRDLRTGGGLHTHGGEPLCAKTSAGQVDGTDQPDLQKPDRRWPCLALYALLLAALLVRMPGITNPPLEFHPVRQYHGALLARAYYDSVTGSSDHARSAVIQAGKPQEVEPPVLEAAATVGYVLLGGERLWVPRLLAVLGWLVGAVVLYAIAKRLMSTLGALIATAGFLFFPYGIIVSRSIQPDSLFVLALLLFALATLRYSDEPGRRNGAVLLIAAFLAVFIKLVGIFYVAGMLLLSVARSAAVRDRRRMLALAALGAALGAMYTLVGMVTGGWSTDTDGRIVPQMLAELRFWRSWGQLIDHVVRWPLVLALGAAVIVARDAAVRIHLAGWLLGYACFGLVFTYHYATHDYYHLPLLVPTALALGVLADRLAPQVRSLHVRMALLALGAVALLVFTAAAMRISLAGPQGGTARMLATWQAAGAASGHPTSAILLSEAHGFPLRYHGLVAGSAWISSASQALNPRRGIASESPAAQLARLQLEGHHRLVVTDLDVWTEEHELRRLLASHPRTSGEGFIVIDLTSAR